VRLRRTGGDDTDEEPAALVHGRFSPLFGLRPSERSETAPSDRLMRRSRVSGDRPTQDFDVAISCGSPRSEPFYEGASSLTGLSASLPVANRRRHLLIETPTLALLIDRYPPAERRREGFVLGQHTGDDRLPRPEGTHHHTAGLSCRRPSEVDDHVARVDASLEPTPWRVDQHSHDAFQASSRDRPGHTG